MKYKLFIIAAVLFTVFLTPAGAAAIEPPVNAQIAVLVNLRRVELNWQASATAGVSYRVYRSQLSAATGEILVDHLPVLNYVDTAVSYGTTYYYRLAAVLDSTVSTLVGPLSAAPTLNPPTAVTAVSTEQGGEIKITWQRPTEGLVLTYNVYRSTSDNSLGDLIAREVNGVEYVNTNTENGTRYYYRVKAVDTGSREGTVSQLAIGIANDKKAPAAPVAAGNFETPDKAYISWNAPPNERSLTYGLYRSQGLGVTGDLVTTTGDRSYRQYSLPLGATYYYSVTAIDGASNVSAASNQVKIIISPPAAVVNTPKATNFTAEGTANSGEILLRWRVPGEGNVAYSRVYRSLAANGEPSQIADRVAGSSYLDKNVKAGERYYFNIRLVNKDGVEYQSSGQVSATAFDPANRSQGATPAPAKTITPVKSAPATSPKFYAYNKTRLANLRLETALANNLRKFLVEKLGAKRVPRVLHQVLIKAYLYGGYSVDEIAHTITNGPGLVHPTIPAVVWRKSGEYQRHR